MNAWLNGGKFATDVEAHLRMTDNEVTAALLAIARNPKRAGHDPASRIVRRDHFRVLYERNPIDVQKNPEAASAIFKAAERNFGSQNLRFDSYPAKGGHHDFPVLMSDGRVVTSGSASSVLLKLPLVATEFVYIIPDYREKAAAWLETKRKSIIERGKSKNG